MEPDQTLVILGASGDLTARLLLPGLGGLLATGSVTGLQLIGSAVDDWDDDRWRSQIAESFAEANARGEQVDAIITNARYLKCDVTDADDLHALLEGCREPVILYFALPPLITEKACHALTATGAPPGTRLVIEKPFGSDIASAAALNDLLTRLVPEDHVHRVDHFVAMPTVLNILGVRFANRMVEPVLNSQHMHSVDVIFDESLALEGTADYYDSTGAMVDMIQSHMLEVMSLFAMEPVSNLEAEDVRDAKAQVLRATRIWNDDPIAFSRRARYTAGDVDGRRVPSYVDEEGIDGSRGTETFAELVLAVDTWRWSGVHLGIALGPNVLRVDLNLSGSGDPFQIDPVSMEGSFAPGDLPPYGEVLKGILGGWPPALGAWRHGGAVLEDHRAGTPRLA